MKLPIMYQRVEAAAVLIASIYFYYHLHFNFLVFILVLFVFDVSMAGYLINKRIGANTYNIFHSLLGPAITVILGASLNNRMLICLSLIWLAHIGLDRALGYGLKKITGFNETHLGHIGEWDV
jgi:hypothetical protein